MLFNLPYHNPTPGVFGSPRFTFARWHLKTTLGIQSCSILNTCPSHLKRLNVMSLVMFSLLFYLYSWIFCWVKWSGKFVNGHLLWKASSLRTSVLTTCEHWTRQKNGLLYSSIFVSMLYCWNLQMEQSWGRPFWARLGKAQDASSHCSPKKKKKLVYLHNYKGFIHLKGLLASE